MVCSFQQNYAYLFHDMIGSPVCTLHTIGSDQKRMSLHGVKSASRSVDGELLTKTFSLNCA